MRVELQRNDIDDVLRNKLWSALTLLIFQTNETYISGSTLEWPLKRLWMHFWGQPIDEMSNYWSDVIRWVRKWFFDAKWYEIYDFLEQLTKELSEKHPQARDNLSKALNTFLEDEMSAYRFVGGEIGEITSDEEISAIEDALRKSKPLDPVYTHLRDALSKLTDRSNPDYRNSIKESISAVESICKIITKAPSATLGEALKKLEEAGIIIHPALKKAWGNLYGFASDANGIRHSLIDQPTTTFGEAKYMMVSCSAFINYLIELTTKAGIIL